MIIITAPSYDPLGVVEINELPSSDTEGHARRVNRIQTLDGGVDISDGGYSHGDRTLTILWRPAQAEADSVVRLAQTYPLLNISTRDGAYNGAISKVQSSNGQQKIEFLIKGELA